MKLGNSHPFLVLERREPDGLHTVEIVPSQGAALRKWGRSTRLSPLFSLAGNASPLRLTFRGRWEIIFLGPVHPDVVLPLCGAKSSIWVTMGLFNVVVASRSAKQIARLAKWAEAQPFAFEVWEIKDGRVLKARLPVPQESKRPWRRALSDLSEAHLPPELHEAIQEYCPLMASTLARSELLRDGIASDLLRLSEFLSQAVSTLKRDASCDSRYRALGQVLTINAGLSRFASQTFAGTPPIVETECHYWSNSLLGIGTATLGLWCLCRFLDRTLGEQRLPERFARLRHVTQVPDLTTQNPPVKDYLGEIELPRDAVQPVIPLLAFFSARDGYRSTATTISAPLAAVSSCNSLRWSLLTLTHEISHVIIRGVLADLYPNLDDESELEGALQLIDGHRPGPTLFDEIRRIMFFAISKMDDVRAERPEGESKDLTPEVLRRLLENWRQEVDETLVHAFDFTYFYGRDVDRYVRGIWMSWGTIPNVSTRVREYVVRTICAVMVKHVRKAANAEELAKESVLQCLRTLAASDHGGRYVDQAIRYIENDWKGKIRPIVRARWNLIKIVEWFMFSSKIATVLRGEPEISGDAPDKEGYTLRPCSLEFKTIRNPLRFLELYTEAKPPLAAEALWMYLVLAFCVRADES
jgi:hypothetical protein